MKFIDLNAQYDHMKNDIQKAVNRVLASGDYILGDEVSNLENRLAKYIGSKHCITVANGTDAIQIALMSLDLNPDDEIIVPSHTWISTATAAKILGLSVRFVDVELDSFNISISDLKNRITPKTKVIIAVSLYGQCADFDELQEICNANNIILIEDAAQSFGAKYKEKNSCNIADISTTSFFPTKPLGCYGDGGAIFTSNDGLADKMRMISRHGQKIRHHHEILGMNSRLDALQAAILDVKLNYFDAENKSRQKIAEHYKKLFQDNTQNITIPFIKEHNQSVFAQYVILTDNREKILSVLKERNIPTAIYYPTPIHEQPIFSENASTFLPNTEIIKKCGLGLPFSPYINKDDQELVAEAILSAC